MTERGKNDRTAIANAMREAVRGALGGASLKKPTTTRKKNPTAREVYERGLGGASLKPLRTEIRTEMGFKKKGMSKAQRGEAAEAVRGGLGGASLKPLRTKGKSQRQGLR